MSQRKSQVPKFARWLLERYANKVMMEDLLGDLDELFFQNVKKKGLLKAQLGYWIEVSSLLFSYALKKRKRDSSYSTYYFTNSMSMFKNYFKVAVRNFAKQKLFTTINVLGLAMGMSVSLLILGVLSQVLQFDHFHTNKDQIYRVLTDAADEDGKRTYATAPLGVYDDLGENYPGIRHAVRVNYGLDLTLDHRNNEIMVSGIYTDPNYFDVFSFDLTSGNKATALSEPNSIILSPELAAKLFPDENPLGKVLTSREQGDFKVTGILKQHPRQTHLNAEALASYSTIDPMMISAKERWTRYGRNYVYLYLDANKSQSDLSIDLEALSKKANTFFDDRQLNFEAQAFTKISPGKNLFHDNTPFDWMMTVFLFCLGLLILIPACFNYTNLMIARGIKRGKEIGIRKVVGSNRKQIRYQFIVEAVILTTIALIGSIFIFTLIRAQFLDMVIGSETLDLSLSFNMISWFVVFGLLTGIGAGVFPALYFSKIEPLQSLKSEIQSSVVSISAIRKSIIVAQFTISLVFIIGVGVIIKQHEDILNYDLGFDKENVLAVPLKGVDHQLVVNEFAKVPGVSQASLSSNLPGIEAGLISVMIRPEINPNDSIQVYQVFADEAFIQALGFKMKWGESVMRTGSAREHFLVNEAFMRVAGNLSSDTLNFIFEDQQKGQLSGVLKDFNFMQLNMAIRPLIVRLAPEKANYALLNVAGNNLLTTVDQLEDKWTSIDETTTFESFFLDQRIEESFRTAFGIIKIFGFLGALSLTISCIGLLGMVVYFTENRVKEVAVRKIMGATLSDLYVTLGGSFLKLLGIAILIATPLSYFFYDRLFVNMISKYSVGVGWVEMVGSIAFMLVLGLLPILWMITKISRVNPATNLRYE